MKKILNNAVVLILLLKNNIYVEDLENQLLANNFIER